jgi:hypothetical protein
VREPGEYAGKKKEKAKRKKRITWQRKSIPCRVPIGPILEQLNGSLKV